MTAPAPVEPTVTLNEPAPTPAPTPSPVIEEQGPIVGLDNGYPPSKPTSFSSSLPAPVGDPYVVTLPDPKPRTTAVPQQPAAGTVLSSNLPGPPVGDPYVITLPDSRTKTTAVPNVPNGDATFTNFPGLPAGESYVVTLPELKPSQTTAVPQPPNGDATFTNFPGFPAGDPYVVTLPEWRPKTTAPAQPPAFDPYLITLPAPKPDPSATSPPADGISFANSVGAPPGDPYLVTLPGPRAGSSRVKRAPDPKQAGNVPPPAGHKGVYSGLENPVSSPNTESAAVSLPSPVPSSDAPPVGFGKYEPYHPKTLPSTAEPEVAEAPEATGNAWAPIVWETAAGKPKSVDAAPKPIAEPPEALPSPEVSAPTGSDFPGFEEQPVAPAPIPAPSNEVPSIPTTLSAPQPNSGPTSVALPPSAFPDLENEASPMGVAPINETPAIPTNVAAPALPGLESTDSSKPQEPPNTAAVPVAEPAPKEPSSAKIPPPASAPARLEAPARNPQEANPANPQSNASNSKSTAALYMRCGGKGWTGPTICASGSECKVQNEWYSQCVSNDSVEVAKERPAEALQPARSAPSSQRPNSPSLPSAPLSEYRGTGRGAEEAEAEEEEEEEQEDNDMIDGRVGNKGNPWE